MGKRTLVKFIYPFLRLYWFIVRPNAFGVQCLIQHGGEILMVRNTYGHKLWTFPGGGIVRGETAEQAIRREVMEEVGIHVQKLQKIGEFESRDEYRRDRVVVFAGESKGRQVTIQEAEILEARWCNPEHLPTLSSSAEKIMAMWQHEESY